MDPVPEELVKIWHDYDCVAWYLTGWYDRSMWFQRPEPWFKGRLLSGHFQTLLKITTTMELGVELETARLLWDISWDNLRESICSLHRDESNLRVLMSYLKLHWLSLLPTICAELFPRYCHLMEKVLNGERPDYIQ
jgi:hypothetical protein